MAADHLIGVTDEFAGDVRQASDTLERAVATHQPSRGADYRRTFGVDPGMQARSMSSRAIWALGYPDRALERARETVAIAEGQSQQPLVFIFANLVLQGVHVYRGEAEEAIALGDQIIDMCDEYSFPQEHAWSDWPSRARRMPRRGRAIAARIKSRARSIRSPSFARASSGRCSTPCTPRRCVARVASRKGWRRRTRVSRMRNARASTGSFTSSIAFAGSCSVGGRPRR